MDSTMDELEELDTFLDTLDPEFCGVKRVMPTSRVEPQLSDQATATIRDTFEGSEVSSSSLARENERLKRISQKFRPKSAGLFSDDDDDNEIEGNRGTNNEIISRLLSELTLKDQKIAELTAENDELQNELIVRKSLDVPAGSQLNDSSYGASTSSPNSRRPLSGGFSSSKYLINERINNLGFDSVESLEDLMKGFSLVGTPPPPPDMIPEDPLAALGFNKKSPIPPNTGDMSVMLGSTNLLLLTEAQKAELDARRERERKQRLQERIQQDREGALANDFFDEGDDGDSYLRSHRSSDTDSDEARLFRDSETPPPTRKEDRSQNEMDYQEFVHKLMRPECEVLVGVIRRFLSSVLGPNGDGSKPPANAKLDYTFVGTQNLSKRCRDFFDAMKEHFMAHPSWRSEPEERLSSAEDCLERYVMNRISDLAFADCCAPAEDDFLIRRMQLLSFLKPEALEIKPELRNEIIWALAIDELRKMTHFRNPSEKIKCIENCVSVIFRSLNVAQLKAANGNGGSDSPSGADDFLPIFIWIVLRSHIPKLYSNCEYIQAFHSPRRLMGKSGYCFVNLRSALEFVMNLDCDSVSGMEPGEFDLQLRESERRLAMRGK